jgi:hypothetical protein
MTLYSNLYTFKGQARQILVTKFPLCRENIGPSTLLDKREFQSFDSWP